MSILSLDLGTKTGWCISSNGKYISSGTTGKSPKPEDHPGLRWARFLGWLDYMNENHSIQKVYFEEVMMLQKAFRAAHTYGGFKAALEEWSLEQDVLLEGVAIGTIKKHITGKGNAKKDAVIAAVVAKGYPLQKYPKRKIPYDNNEADAVALMDLVLSRGGTHEKKS